MATNSTSTPVTNALIDRTSPWQRGSNENTHGLLRQYFPKGTSLACFNQADSDTVASERNQRPRNTLDFNTPENTLNQMMQ